MVPLTVLWFGGGQDSTDILYRLIHDKVFRVHYAPGQLVVIMSDTGNEFDFTYRHIDQVRSICLRHDIEFYLIEPWMGYHSPSWQSLTSQYVRNHNIQGAAFAKTCTDNLKIKPNYRFLADYIREVYGFTAKGNLVFYQYVERFGQLRSLIGFARGEESRCGQKAQLDLFAEALPDQRPLWMQRCIKHAYPLIELGVDRAGCQSSIAAMGYEVPMPSNCKMCPFAAGPELLFLHRFYPADWHEWVEHEQRKIAKNASKVRNLGVKGEKLLPQALAEAEARWGHLSDEQLIEYRMSHGHNVKSKY